MAVNYETYLNFGKENADALVKSGTAAVKGFEALTKFYSTVANRSIEMTSDAVKTLTTAKTPVDVQAALGGIAKQGFDSFVTDARAAQELTGALVNESLAPITERFQAVSSLFKAA